MNSPIGADQSIYCFGREENIKSISISFLTRSNYELLPKINRKLRAFIESGLLEKWERDSTLLAHRSGPKNSLHFHRMTMEQFFGVFSVFGWLILMCWLVLLLELLAHRGRRYFSRSWMRRVCVVVERIVDGRRYTLL